MGLVIFFFFFNTWQYRGKSRRVGRGRPTSGFSSSLPLQSPPVAAAAYVWPLFLCQGRGPAHLKEQKQVDVTPEEGPCLTSVR